MTIFIGTDHRGFELKNKLLDYLQDKNIRVEDMGNYEYDAEDDNPDYAKKVAQAVLQNPSEFLGIVICGSGIGVSMAANRFKGIRCALGFDISQVKHGRENDHINVLAIPAEYTDFETATQMIDTFIQTPIIKKEKYLRRSRKLDE
ncbi:MAG: RpiB/LacA/LacB family sugar-phosphate isomerase [Candidatus Roizmanbacteria bacterium]|nr:MAG: RpiB/LacA/LacB family sugar-phosphate isomerase [Candidatus Roizmanbacteria bacterium]